MRYTTLLPLAAAATAFVIPDEATAQQLVLETKTYHDESSWWANIPSIDQLRSSLEDTFSSAVDAFDASAKSLADALPELDVEIPDFLPAAWEFPGKGRHGKHGHHGHHGITNLTIYEAIHKSKYTTKFAKLIDEYPELVEALNSTEHNVTAFIPTDKAFEKIPEHKHKHKKIPKEFIEKALKYHLLHGLYPAGKLLVSHTLPTAVQEEDLGGKPQRLRLSFGLFGLRVNFYSKVVVPNLFTANGVIHGVDHILVPPPPFGTILSLFPTKFSTLFLAAEKSGLGEDIHGIPRHGGTFFAPTNKAFQKLGPRANAFLFNTEKGHGYLRALLKYHVVINETLYSDAYYGEERAGAESGHTHVDLATLLGTNLSIDIARWAGFITVKINGHTRVAVQDVLAKGGVIQVVDSVLIPPHKHHGHGAYVDGDEIEVEDLVGRLEPYLESKNTKPSIGEL